MERIAADLLDRCHEDPGADGPSAAALRGVGGDVATLVEIDPVAGRAYRHGHAPGDLSRVVPQLYPYLARHPVPTLMRTRGSLRPVRVTDLGPAGRWRNSAARAELAAHMGMRYQLIIPLRATTRSCCALGLMRAGRDFTERELDIAEWIQPVLLGWWYRRTPQRAAGIALSPRERQVLNLLAEGLTVPAIGHRLGISPHTAARHTERIHRKLGTHDRASTVLLAQRLGALDDGGPDPQ